MSRSSRGLGCALHVALLLGACNEGDANVDPARSLVVANRATDVNANGVDEVTITVTVLSRSGRLAGRTVVLSATGDGNILTQPATPTGRNGVAIGRLVSTGIGEKTITARVLGQAGEITLAASALVTFVVPRPTLTAINPTSQRPGGVVIISGLDLESASAVSFGGGPDATVTENSATSITAIVPPGSASGAVTVTTRTGTGSLPGFVLLPGPVITVFTPMRQRIGRGVQINGSGLAGATVTFGLGGFASIEENLSTRIRARVPPGSSNGDVSVTAREGRAMAPGFVLDPTCDVAFVPQQVISTVGAPLVVALADLNADRRLDLVAATLAVPNNRAVVRLGDGTGNFQAAVDHSIGSRPQAIAIADLNLDGKPDLAVALGGDDAVAILLGNGDGSFQPAVNHPAGKDPRGIASADFNADGKPDLAFAGGDGNGNSVSVRLGNGDGSFLPLTSHDLVRAIALAIVAADLNADTRVDLIVGHNGVSRPTVLLGNGNGTFAPPIEPLVQGPGAVTALAIADLDNDSRPDVAIANYALETCPGNGDGSLRPCVIQPSPPTSIIATSDLDLDGNVDLVNAEHLAVTVCAGNGDGSFLAPLSHVIASSGPGTFPARAITMGDLNRDSRPDVVLLREDIKVLLSRCNQ